MAIVPHDWVGRRVQFWLEGAQRNAVGQLVQVSDYGVVLAFTPQGEGADQTTFYPWHVVRAIALEQGQSSEVGVPGGHQCRYAINRTFFEQGASVLFHYEGHAAQRA